MAEAALTKRLIADSLKALCREKPFDKISVGEITERSNVNRQTFYYHFQDKYDLLSWIYYEDYFNPNIKGLTFDNWTTKVAALLQAVREDRAFCVNTIRHTGAEMTRVFLRDTEQVMTGALDYVRSRPALSGKYLNEMDREEESFIARFFAFGVCGSILEWVDRGMKEEPEVLAYRMKILLESCKQIAYKRVREERGE